jgi:para-nitrobenzyl esterase
MALCEGARFGGKSALRMAQLSAMVAITLGAMLGITSAAASTLVETTNGWVQGKTVASVDQWLGIRYAASPAGVNRWTPPKPPGSYGTRQNPYAATQFGAPCPQNISQFGNSIPLPTPPNTVPVPGSADSENCLFLNVYVPAGRSSEGGGPLPVLFWIHGGSNEYGEGSSYDPTPLVTQGHIIVVTINYRLGALGWLAHPLVDNGAPNSSGNYGLMDQQFAMRWVNRNISAFGGYPHKVTIAGESAGGFDTCSHLASPTAAGLFRGAIIESGCIIFQYPQAVLEAVSGDPFVEALGCTTLACLQAAPISAVLAAELSLGWIDVVGPNVPTLPEAPQQAFSDGAFNKVPVIQGTNLDEGRLFIPLFNGVVTSSSYASTVAGLFAAYPNPPLATIESRYPIANYSTDGAAAAPGEAVAAIVTDSLFACTARTADQLLSQHVPVWAYEFKDTKAPELFNLPTVFPYGATHASELQFIFDPNAFFPNVDYQVPTDPFPLSPVEQGLSRDMVRYWTNFVATLDPNQSGTGLKPSLAGWSGEGDFWRRYDSTSDDVQALTTPLPHPEFHFGAEHQCSLWEQVGLESGL